jgi:putative ABC transport system substrate-binding protein
MLGGAAVGWPLAARAQERERMRRIGVLMYTTPDEPESQARIAALAQGLQEAGWAIGRNVRIDTRWSGGDVARLHKDAVELVALGSDVLVAGAGPTTGTLQQATRTVPIVFAQGLDPVGNGFIRSLARPGGNTTGFNQFEYGLSGKWLGLLREIAPQVSRVGVVRDLAGGPAGVGQWAVIQAFASPMGVELSPIHARIMGGETERDVADFASAPNGGRSWRGPIATIQRDLIVALPRGISSLAFPYRFFVEAGGLMSYGPNLINLKRRGGVYVTAFLWARSPQIGPTVDQVRTGHQSRRQGLGSRPLTLLSRADEASNEAAVHYAAGGAAAWPLPRAQERERVAGRKGRIPIMERQGAVRVNEFRNALSELVTSRPKNHAHPSVFTDVGIAFRAAAELATARSTLSSIWPAVLANVQRAPPRCHGVQ